jgi:hypothetical protein
MSRDSHALPTEVSGLSQEPVVRSVRKQFGPGKARDDAMTDISDPRRAVQETTTKGALRVLEEQVIDV